MDQRYPPPLVSTRLASSSSTSSSSSVSSAFPSAAFPSTPLPPQPPFPQPFPAGPSVSSSFASSLSPSPAPSLPTQASTQSVINVFVQFGEFVGIDIYQRGFYALRARVYCAAPDPAGPAPHLIRIDAVPTAVYFDADLRKACHHEDQRTGRFAPTTAAAARLATAAAATVATPASATTTVAPGTPTVAFAPIGPSPLRKSSTESLGDAMVTSAGGGGGGGDAASTFPSRQQFVFPSALAHEDACHRKHSTCTWHCKQPKHSFADARADSARRHGQNAVAMHGGMAAPLNNVFWTPTFRVEYHNEAVLLQCGVNFRLEVDLMESSALEEDNRSIFLEVELFFTSDERATRNEALQPQQFKRFRLRGLTDVGELQRPSHLHSHTLCQFDGVFFSTCDLIVSAACLGFRSNHQSRAAIAAAKRAAEAMASSDFGCGTGNFWGWLARSLFRGGRDRSIQQQQQQQKQAQSSARVVKYLLEPAKVEEMIRDSSSVRLSRTSFDFEDVRSVFGSEQFQVESLMLAMIGIVQLQSSIVHDFAVFGLTLQSARATVDGPLRLLSSDQILSLLSSGLGPRRMIDSSSLRRDLPAVGDDGRLAVLKGFATLVSPYLKDGSNEKSLRLADICDVVSSKLDALWETYISGFGLVSRKSLIFMRQQSGKKLLARKELYLLGPEPLLGYEAHLAKIWRANKDESFLSECSNTPPAIIFELLRKAAQPTVSFAASIAPTEVLSPNIRRLRAPSRGPQFQISSSPVPFADVRSIDDEASIRGITTASVLSGEASVIVAPAITTRAPSSSFVNVGPRLDDIEVAIDNLRGRGAPSVIERRTSFVGSIGSSAWFPQTDVASVILDPETKTQASAFAPATHLVVFVHGLLGSAFDLRQYRNRSAFWRHWMNIPDTACEFMISSANEDDTFADIEVLADRLVGEIMTFIEEQSIYVERLSFVCHSLGGVIARCAVSKAAMEPFWPKLYSFTSLASPHLSLALHNNSLLNSFIGFYQVIDKSKCLDQLYMKDHHDPRQTLLYRLSCLREGGLGHFKFVRLLASPQDGYVNAGSALAVGEGRPKRWTSPMSCRSEDEEVDFESSPTDVMDFVGGNPSAPAQTRRIYQEMVANFEAQLASGLVGASTSSSTTMPTAATASTTTTTTTPAAAAGSAAQVTRVEKFLVLFGSVHRSSGWDVVRRRGHVAMLEDSAFIEMLVFINKLHL